MRCVGYENCLVCGALVHELTARQTRGLCMEHFMAGVNPDVRELELINAGKVRKALLATNLNVINSRRNVDHRSTHVKMPAEEVRRRSSRAKDARVAALTRMANLYPETFYWVYTEERAKRGLPPQFEPREGYLVHGVVTYQPNSIYPRCDDEPGGMDGDPPEDEGAGARQPGPG